MNIIILPNVRSSSRFRYSSMRRRTAWCGHLKTESCSDSGISVSKDAVEAMELDELGFPLLFFNADRTSEAKIMSENNTNK